jgi:hypothetical protein
VHNTASTTRSPRRPIQVMSNTESSKRRLQVSVVEKLHLTIDGRSLCGLVTIDESDVYDDAAGLRAWNDGPLEQCSQCGTALVTRIRQPAKVNDHQPHRRSGRNERLRPAELAQLINERGGVMHSDRTNFASDPSVGRRQVLVDRLAELATEMQDLVGRVLSNGGEPNYASEKMGRAVREGMKALAVIDELFLERYQDGTPELAADLEIAQRSAETGAEATRYYIRERECWS